MRNTMHERHVTLDVFCKRHPKLAAEARALVAAGAVALNPEGKVSENLLRTAATYTSGKMKLKRQTSTIIK